MLINISWCVISLIYFSNIFPEEMWTLVQMYPPFPQNRDVLTRFTQAEKTVRDEQYRRDDVAYRFIELKHGKFIDGCRDRYGSVLSA